MDSEECTAPFAPGSHQRFSLSAVSVLVALLAAAGEAPAETRGYAVSLIHTATYSHDDNCPNGGNGGNVEINKRILTRLGYSEAEAMSILANGGKDEYGVEVDLSKRAELNGEPVDIHTYPTLVPDPEIEVVQGKYAYGFNLDGKVTATSFEHPETGEKGIDNQMWRVLGCFEVYDVRRPVIPYNEGIAWDTAMDAMPAWLISISGEDLSKDGDVTVTFDRSLNIAMRNAHGDLLAGSSYTIDPDPRSHSEFKGRIANRIVTIEPGEFSMQGESQFYAMLRFTGTQLRLQLHDDGTLTGYIGGYQPWMDYFHYLAIRSEGTAQVDIPGVFYAMRRHADADPEAGQNWAISAAYYLEARPVFHTTRDGEIIATAWEGEPTVEQHASTASSTEAGYE